MNPDTVLQPKPAPALPLRAPKRKAAAPRKAGTKPSREVQLLRGLHSAWKDALEAHRIRVAGQFRLAEQAAGKRHTAKALERARQALKVRVKPGKGRAKDLRRVEEALDDVLGRLGGA